MTKKPEKAIEEILTEDGRYPLAAIQFVREGLNHTVTHCYPNLEPGDSPRHVTGEQLCRGLKELAQKRWGFMAQNVLKRWNIKSTRDFGEIIFLMVNSGWMQKQPQDSIEDFDKVYDFNQAFQRDFKITFDKEK